ncbi:hypothetical protein [Roseateles chitosanitabidus]|uniref:hypothetical protein n=1 Tax=Roseateles chitosanitabidus TaxID=65048 RepID=UPI00082CCBFC|nr:hypothetical protein [Roseateles chitosanitabidus]
MTRREAAPSPDSSTRRSLAGLAARSALAALIAFVAFILAAVMLLLVPTSASAQLVPPEKTEPRQPTLPALRDQEIAQCLPGEIRTWGDGRDRPIATRALRFAYRHEAAPPWFSEGQVLTLVRQSAQAWSACGLRLDVIAVPRGQVPPEDAIQVLWSDAGSRGQFALANVTARSLSISPGLFALLRERNPKYPADQTLQMVLSHEMGHFLGLMAHSRRCVDTMSYYDNGKGERCALRDPKSWGSVIEYRSMLPTACDIDRCKALNAPR